MDQDWRGRRRTLKADGLLPAAAAAAPATDIRYDGIGLYRDLSVVPFALSFSVHSRLLSQTGRHVCVRQMQAGIRRRK